MQKVAFVRTTHPPGSNIFAPGICQTKLQLTHSVLFPRALQRNYTDCPFLALWFKQNEFETSRGRSSVPSFGTIYTILGREMSRQCVRCWVPTVPSRGVRCPLPSVPSGVVHNAPSVPSANSLYSSPFTPYPPSGQNAFSFILISASQNYFVPYIFQKKYIFGAKTARHHACTRIAK